MMRIPLPPMFDRKEMLRLALARQRKAVAEQRPNAAQHAASIFLTNIPHKEGDTIAAYHPIKQELDPAPLSVELRQRGHDICLPVVIGKSQPLIFREHKDSAPLLRGAFGVREPLETAAVMQPDILLVPLLGFDRSGNRLGYGGGFYDRTLQVLRATRKILSVGYAYGAQEVDAVPVSRLDQPLDWIVTERGATRVN